MECGIGTLDFVRSFSGRGVSSPLVFVSFLPFDPPGQKGGKHDEESQKSIYSKLQWRGNQTRRGNDSI